ncbi:hypothetical protein D1AOALGA4SA_11364 [Olavius algarvensis Delta 1 endosymbiont]|nr:hypothetical protein D1AOALGA4SA_11364 [Olavius algarvensis Delta 1 endosymbiont]
MSGFRCQHCRRPLRDQFTDLGPDHVVSHECCLWPKKQPV